MEILSLGTLPQYDSGSVGVLVDKALRDAYLDLDDRPLLKKSRKITITIDLKPRDTDGNNLETAECAISVKLTMPNKESRVNIVANDRKGGGLGFEADTRVAKHHRNQASLPYKDGEGKGE